MKKSSKLKDMSDGEAVVWTAVFFFGFGILVIFISSLFYGSNNDYNPSSAQETKTTQTELTPEIKEEICREIEVYLEYCWVNGITATDCGQQAAEKIPRIFKIDSQQTIEVVNYCIEK